MAAVSLIFNQQGEPIKGGPVQLVFGASGGIALPTVVAVGGGRVTGLRGHLRLRTVARAGGGGRVTGLRGRIEAHWDANVSRGMRAEVRAAWQEGVAAVGAADDRWQGSQPVRIAAVAPWQDGLAARGGMLGHWQETERLRAAGRGHWQQAAPARGGMDARWQDGERLRAAVRGAWQQGRPARAALDAHWEETLRLRAAVRSAWQEAAAVRASMRTGHGDAARLRITLRPHWQEARRPPVGLSGLVPPVQPPCYVPGLPVALVFKVAADSRMPLRLVFTCEGQGGTNPGGTVVVPARRSYIVINSVEIRRADALAGDPLPSESFQMRLDRQSWTWSFSAAFHASARDALAPGLGGQPVELEVRVNGQPFRLQGERIGRSRRLPEHLVTVSGRGRAALLDAPYAPVQTFGNGLDVTAHQLMTEVLTLNGVGFGWSVDWQLTDWLVPGGAWMHQGTYISALADIAGAVGGYLQPHDVDPVLRVLPSWPLPWWRFGELVPDFDLPEGLAEVDETEVMDRPDYDRIFVAGEGFGNTFDLTRSGLPGTVLKQPMAVHALLADLVAAKQRAIAELSDSGRALMHKMTLPVLPATGVIKPGQVLRYYDDASAQRVGLVRSTILEEQFPVLTQSLEVESHA